MSYIKAHTEMFLSKLKKKRMKSEEKESKLQYPGSVWLIFYIKCAIWWQWVSFNSCLPLLSYMHDSCILMVQ